MITGEIKRFLRDDGMIKVSRSLKETAVRVRVAGDELGKKLGREATIEEISSYIDTSTEDVVIAVAAVSEVESLYKTIYQGDGSPVYLLDKLEGEEDQQTELVNKMALHEVLASLEESEKEIIQLRYFEEKTQSEIAKVLGISQVQVSRLEKKILKKMKEKFA